LSPWFALSMGWILENPFEGRCRLNYRRELRSEDKPFAHRGGFEIPRKLWRRIRSLVPAAGRGSPSLHPLSGNASSFLFHPDLSCLAPPFHVITIARSYPWGEGGGPRSLTERVCVLVRWVDNSTFSHPSANPYVSSKRMKCGLWMIGRSDPQAGEAKIEIVAKQPWHYCPTHAKKPTSST